jgi:hypothetical protein
MKHLVFVCRDNEENVNTEYNIHAYIHMRNVHHIYTFILLNTLCANTIYYILFYILYPNKKENE